MNRKQKVFLWIVIFLVVFILTLPLPTLYGIKGRWGQFLAIAVMLCLWPKTPKGGLLMNGSVKALELLAEFYGVVDSIYGVYLDSTRGFHLLTVQHDKEQQLTVKMLKKTDPDLANIEYLNQRQSIYGKGDPNKPGFVELHKCTQAELRGRNEEGGTNHKFIANMCLISIYQYWDWYREKIEHALGVDKNSIQSDIMGDIKWLRESIIHHKAVALKKIEKCKAIKWFKKNDEISIDKNMFETMIRHIYLFIAELEKEMYSGLEDKTSKNNQKQ